MKSHFRYSAVEILVALGILSLTVYLLLPMGHGAFFSFLKGLPWNP